MSKSNSKHSSDFLSIIKKNHAVLYLVLAFFILIFFILSFGILKNNQISDKKQGLSSEETRFSESNKELLKNHDYGQYQSRLTTFADAYIAKKQYDQAERVLNQVISDVPENEITSEVYISYWSLYYHKKDNDNRKKYAQLASEKLKSEGQDERAAAFEKDAE